MQARTIPEAVEVHLNEWNFDDLPLSDMETVLCTLRIFVDTGISQSFKIPFDVSKPIFHSMKVKVEYPSHLR